MKKLASMPDIRPRERVVIVISVLYALALGVLAVYIGHGGLSDTKLEIAAVALPVACVAALLLMIGWRKLDGGGR